MIQRFLLQRRNPSSSKTWRSFLLQDAEASSHLPHLVVENKPEIYLPRETQRSPSKSKRASFLQDVGFLFQEEGAHWSLEYAVIPSSIPEILLIKVHKNSSMPKLLEMNWIPMPEQRTQFVSHRPEKIDFPLVWLSRAINAVADMPEKCRMPQCLLLWV